MLLAGYVEVERGAIGPTFAYLAAAEHRTPDTVATVDVRLTVNLIFGL
jgi:hypothetical protein